MGGAICDVTGHFYIKHKNIIYKQILQYTQYLSKVSIMIIMYHNTASETRSLKNVYLSAGWSWWTVAVGRQGYVWSRQSQ